MSGKFSLAQTDAPVQESLPIPSVEKLLPDRQLKYEEELSPEWKNHWDFARELYRQEKYSEALVQYEILFSQKSNIEEARWEYLTILMHLQRWESAKTELEKLLAVDPSSIRYQIAMARVCRETGDIDKALELYLQLVQQSLDAKEKKQVLEGLVTVYERLGEDTSTHELLDELVIIDPDNHTLQLKLAAHELSNGNVEKARDICLMVVQKKPDNVDVLSMLGRIEESAGNSEVAATYWQQVVGQDPDNSVAHGKLSEYYLDNDNPAMSLKHLEQLIRITPDNVNYLQKAAELNIDLGRLDKALEYYEFALAIEPSNQELRQGKKAAQEMIAHDLLALIENDAEGKVWQDLRKITADSTGVYREVANLLRKQEKFDELIKVLQMLIEQNPDDQQIADELSGLLAKKVPLQESSGLQENSVKNIQPKAESN